MHTAAHFMFAKIESRQSRVERKALVFFPTLNKRLSQFQRSIPGLQRLGGLSQEQPHRDDAVIAFGCY